VSHQIRAFLHLEPTESKPTKALHPVALAIRHDIAKPLAIREPTGLRSELNAGDSVFIPLSPSHQSAMWNHDKRVKHLAPYSFREGFQS
jgi:hypothetical protein